MKMKKRLFAILLALCVTFTMMPLTGSGGVAHAEDGTAAAMQPTRTTMLDLTSENGKYIATDGKEKTVNFNITSVTDSAEGWSWNHETKTLTLAGARIVVTKPTFVKSAMQGLPGKTTTGYYYGVKVPGGNVNVVLAEGTASEIRACDATTDDNGPLEENELPRTVLASIGIGNSDESGGSFTMRGGGKLTVKSGAVNNANALEVGQRLSAGIYLFSNVIIEGHAKIEMSGNECISTFGAAYSRGISCSQMTITDNAQVTATGGDVSAVMLRESTGISVSRSLSVRGSARLETRGATVETGENASSTTYSDSMGISAPTFTAFENASVYAYGGMAKGQAGSSAGVYIEGSSGTAEIAENAFLHAEGSESDWSSYGVEGSRDGTATAQLTIAGNAYIEAIGKDIGDNEHYECSGISIKKIQINGGTVVARAEADPTKTNGHIEAIVPMPTYAERLTPTVTAGTTETDAVKIESPDETTYANRWVKIQTRESNYVITAAPSVIDFGTVKTDYAQPAPKTVTITNTGNETVDLSGEVLPENSNYTVSKLSESRIAPRRTAEITVQPKENLPAGEYNETLTISGDKGTSASVELKFNVIKSGGGSGGGAVTPAPAPSDPDAEVITVKEDTKDDTASKPGAEAGTNTTTKTTVKNTTTETIKNEQGQDVSKTTASVSKELGDKLLDQAVSNNSDTIEITVKFNDKNDNNGGNAGGAGVADSVKSTEVKLPKATVDAIAKNTNADLVIKTDNSEVRLDNKTLETIADAAKGDTVTIVVGENTQLKETQKPAADIVGKNGSLFDFIAKIGERLLHQFEGGKAHVTLPMPEKLKDKDVLVIYIDDKGLCKILNHSVEKVGADDYIKFTTTHFSTFAVVDKDEAEQLIQKQNAAHVKELMQNAKFKVTTTKTSKKSVKVQVTAKNNKTLISDIKSMGYTVKYQFYRSTKKSAGYKLLKTKATSTFTNTKGSKGTKYYYKARVLIYDGKTLIAKSGLKECSWGSRVWNK